MSSDQPVYYILKSDVLYWFNHQQNFAAVREYELRWGNMCAPDELVAAVEQLPSSEGWVSFERTVKCIRSFETRKLIGGANRMLDRLISILKSYRVAHWIII